MKNMLIGHNLVRLRKEHQMSQKDVANKVFMSQPNYHYIEKNLQHATEDMIERFAELFGVPLSEITKQPDHSPLYIENQSGNYNNNGQNFFNHSEGEVLALREHIDTLKNQMQTFEMRENQRIKELNDRINALEEEVKFWKSHFSDKQ
jgi:transcriptional regulator with XRE-family HTH domain